MVRTRSLVASFATLALAWSLTACDSRTPVGAHDAGPDHAQIDGFDPPPPWPDFGWPPPDYDKPPWPDKGAPSCTCLPWSGNNSCACNEIFWGCKEKPQRFSVCDLPPPCLLETIDPLTGCRKPKIDLACSESCFQPPPPSCDAAQIGKPCTSSGNECSAGMTCLLTHPDKGGVCTCPCSPDDLHTPLINEDSCPDLSGNVCGTVPSPTSGGRVNLCLRKCSPKLGSNPCTAPIVCAPSSAEVSGERGQAVCALFGCQKDADCPVLTDKPCQPPSSGGPATCPNGDACVSISDDNKEGLCAKSGLCDLASGLCAPRTQHFKATAQVADPCSSDLDCNANQRCERERDLASSAKPAGASCTTGSKCCSGICFNAKCEPGLCPVHARQGYCVVDGCAFASLTAYACPTGSSCNRLFPSGLCQRHCDLTVAGSCRGNALDKLGDYECRSWNQLFIGGVPVSNGPVCDFGDSVRCNTFTSVDCDVFGGQNNTTDMSCRDLSGTKLAPGSPSGLCLDNTSSGPAGP